MTNNMNVIEEKTYFDAVLDEFSGLTNSQAYVNVFSKRIMKPIPKRSGEFYGCDQRIEMLPSLQKLVSKLPRHAEIFDVGAGDAVDFALQFAPSETVINIEEPNKGLISSYIRTLQKYPHLKLGIAYDGMLQDYYQKNQTNMIPKKPQNLILAIHMIYHLTDFTARHIAPKEDLIEAISFLYGLLTSGGSLFIVYADLLDHANEEAVCGMAEKYFRLHNPHVANNLVSIYKARNELLSTHSKIISYLKEKHPTTKPRIESQRIKSHFFGEHIADIAVEGLATELCPSDNEPFDLEKLKFCLQYVSHHPNHIGLEKEERNVPQKGMWRANEPQVISIITRE